MSIFKSGNPTLSQRSFEKNATSYNTSDGIMSVRGTLNKFGFLLLMVMAGAMYAWHLNESMQHESMFKILLVGGIGGFIAALVIVFKPNLAGYVAPLYGLLEGLFIGGLSAIVNEIFNKKYPGIVLQAVGLTFGVAFSMFLLYRFKIIKATEKFKSVIITATMGIGVFYLITLVLRLFNINLPFMYDGSTLGIGISLFIVAIAALNLILDFDRIEEGCAQGAPKFMEWYSAFGLLVTLVWLYLEILKLLMRLAQRD